MRNAFLTLAVASLAWTSYATAEPLVEGHTARMLTSGQASFRERYRNIADADVIMMKTYDLVDDETGREMIEALRQRALAGARVILQYDVKGSNHSGLPGLLAKGFSTELPPYIQVLADAGATVIPTNRPTYRAKIYGRDHDKLLVTWKDGEPAKLIMGGINVGNVYAWGGNERKPALGFRDTDIEITGPEVARAIDRMLEAATRTHLPTTQLERINAAAVEISNGPDAFVRTANNNDASVRFFSNDPKDKQNRRTIEQLYERLIGETPDGETITFANAYTLLEPRMRRAMLAAAQRGVKFHMIVNSPSVSDYSTSNLALAFRGQLRTFLPKMPDGSLLVTELAGNDRRNEGAMHQKLAKFGTNGPVLIGSHNFDAISANYNSESVAVVQSHRVSQQFDALMNRMMREGIVRKVDVNDLRKDPFMVKAKAFVLSRVGAPHL